MNPNKKTLIIAEAGVNHNGDFEIAKKLITMAADAGADVIKFQTFITEKLVSESAILAEYQQKNLNTRSDKSQLEMLKKLEMPQSWYPHLKRYAEEKKIIFCSTAFEMESLDFLCEMGIPFIKIPSGEITNKPFLLHIATKKLPIVLSTGMANIDEIKEAVSVLTTNGVPFSEITILHCTTEYPAPLEDVNLMAMTHIQKELHVTVGYSDHTLGNEVSIGAVALGAEVIEKHITLDKSFVGPDHKASMEPDEFKKFVNAIRNIEKAIKGHGRKEAVFSETKNKLVARKSIHLKNRVSKGQIIQFSDLEMKRPGSGTSPMNFEIVVGKKATKDLDLGKILDWEDFR
jgi:N-acetylneuraminate synthase/N,N'-diacetyllegionaminate synthase